MEASVAKNLRLLVQARASEDVRDSSESGASRSASPSSSNVAKRVVPSTLKAKLPAAPNLTARRSRSGASVGGWILSSLLRSRPKDADDDGRARTVPTPFFGMSYQTPSAAAERDEVLRQDGAAGRAARHLSHAREKAPYAGNIFCLNQTAGKLPEIPKREEGPVGGRAF